MHSSSFDGLARLLATRKSRRAAITGGIAVGTAAIVATPARLPAQEASPIASPGTGGTSTLAHADANFLYVQVAPSATWEPTAGADGRYTLTLTHFDGQTVYFSDRPERIVGVAPTQPVLDGLGFTPVDPPNAAIVAGEEVLVVELTNPVYDASAGTLTYDAAPIDPADAAAGIQHLAQQQSDRELPQDLGPTSLFIDSTQGECDTFTRCLIISEVPRTGSDCGQYGGGPYYLCPLEPIPGGPVDSCWNSVSATCQPCDSTVTYASMAAACNAAYNQCADDSYNGTCYVQDGW